MRGFFPFGKLRVRMTILSLVYSNSENALCGWVEPCVPGGEGAVALDLVAFFFVFLISDAAAEVFFQGWE
jgi:hypothetical protein